jgi:hypothetical protein
MKINRFGVIAYAVRPATKRAHAKARAAHSPTASKMAPTNWTPADANRSRTDAVSAGSAEAELAAAHA